MTKLDLAKPVQTRDGRPVRMLCTIAAQAAIEEME